MASTASKKYHNISPLTPLEGRTLTLEDILIFFTAAEREPPLGWGQQPELKFEHSSSQKYAQASTCDLSLHLPCCHTHYTSFREAMVESFVTSEFGHA